MLAKGTETSFKYWSKHLEP